MKHNIEANAANHSACEHSKRIEKIIVNDTLESSWRVGDVKMVDTKQCIKCQRVDGADLPFPEVFEINDEGLCNVCESSFDRYKRKLDREKNKSLQKTLE